MSREQRRQHQQTISKVMEKEEFSCSDSHASTAINSSNIGFQLLKKHGWKEGTGLGVSEQGRIEPVQVHVKKNKRGLGADKVKKSTPKLVANSGPSVKDGKEHPPSKKAKIITKKIKKMQELEKLWQEKEFERAFFREFWPENV